MIDASFMMAWFDDVEVDHVDSASPNMERQQSVALQHFFDKPIEKPTV